ncbi:hypothetical protein CSKR_105981 [Clonorchis sinensis]|uniref:Uncharacterized protein n=1 Tax=Clonorchis sinensis TaxID=79923 RepID=A0A3R7C6F6_CLOSI|nr:hypothetical protein CSKR_105981 [Clonorchis sinensis]
MLLSGSFDDGVFSDCMSRSIAFHFLGAKCTPKGRDDFSDGPSGQEGTVKSRKGLVAGVLSNWV